MDGEHGPPSTFAGAFLGKSYSISRVLVRMTIHVWAGWGGWASAGLDGTGIGSLQSLGST